MKCTSCWKMIKPVRMLTVTHINGSYLVVPVSLLVLLGTRWEVVTRRCPGYQWHEVYKLLEDDKTCPDVDGHPHQWIIPGGTCKSVGVAGYTLGGGHSSLSRTLGLGIDSLVSMDVVLADGTVAHCSEQSHPDLFWALKGSGGTSFGVVVRFVFRLSKIPRQMAHGKISFNTLWNKPKRSNLLQRYFDFAQTMPPTLNVYSKCNGVVLEFFYSSTEANHEDGMKHIDQFLQLFKWNDFPDMREAEKVGSFWDYEVLVNLDEFDELPASVYWQSALVTEMTSESVDELVEGFGFLYISSLGGAITNYADDATAYRFRSAAFTISAMKAIILKDNVQDAHSNWASFRSKLGSSYLGAYVNYVDPYMMTNFMTEYYGPNAERLSVVKATYDPTNFWRFPQSIPLP
eukprot:TRINITY_DN3913_c4_g1_i2.p1 TRINITY_DN3913_c4_g1~~TRINITY_DN3913_c4_g1_i2.p1  ORF type:complete len:402 (+),score=84.75 TRINITY_DN3913_c4_g1_i2:438-1643(+)